MALADAAAGVQLRPDDHQGRYFQRMLIFDSAVGLLIHHMG